MDSSFKTIRDGLALLYSVQRKPIVFGAESHGYILNPPLSESVVKQFEDKHRIHLPEDYRSFLIAIGDGGAGPFYGVFRLGEMDDNHDNIKWKEGDGFIGKLSRSFPFNTSWNDLTGLPHETDDEDEYQKAYEAFDSTYWNPDNVNGAIPLCHRGCALRDWLVVTGHEAGHMWHDARADHKGLAPISIGKKQRVTFLEWYTHWLNQAMSEL